MTTEQGVRESDGSRSTDGSAATSTTDEVVLPWWQNPINIAVIAVTLALIGGMVGWLIADSGDQTKSNKVDVGFLQDMWWHHDQAVEMSLTYISRPEVNDGIVRVAKSIAFGQAQETGMMIQLLRDMNAPLESDDGMAMAWMGHSVDPDSMPGMATPEQLNELANATGAEADELFLELMIEHHRGGQDMLIEAADRGANEWVLKYADAWARAQADEIEELEGLLPSAGA